MQHFPQQILGKKTIFSACYKIVMGSESDGRPRYQKFCWDYRRHSLVRSALQQTKPEETPPCILTVFFLRAWWPGGSHKIGTGDLGKIEKIVAIEPMKAFNLLADRRLEDRSWPAFRWDFKFEEELTSPAFKKRQKWKYPYFMRFNPQARWICWPHRFMKFVAEFIIFPILVVCTAWLIMPGSFMFGITC